MQLGYCKPGFLWCFVGLLWMDWRKHHQTSRSQVCWSAWLCCKSIYLNQQKMQVILQNHPLPNPSSCTNYYQSYIANPSFPFRWLFRLTWLDDITRYTLNHFDTKPIKTPQGQRKKDPVAALPGAAEALGLLEAFAQLLEDAPDGLGPRCCWWCRADLQSTKEPCVWWTHFFNGKTWGSGCWLQRAPVCKRFWLWVGWFGGCWKVVGSMLQYVSELSYELDLFLLCWDVGFSKYSVYSCCGLRFLLWPVNTKLLAHTSERMSGLTPGILCKAQLFPSQ